MPCFIRIVLKLILRKVSSVRSGHAALISLSPRADGIKKIIYYSTGRWSLGFVWRGLISSQALSSSVGRPEVETCDSISDLKRAFTASNSYVLVMSGRRIAEVLRAGIPPQRIVYYAPHIEINKSVPRVKELHAVLTQSLFEFNLFLAKGLDPVKVHHFPAGVNRHLFYPPQAISDSDCNLDVLFVGSSYSERQVGERFRKGYALQLELTRRLAESGLRVAVVGPGWDQCAGLSDSRVQVLNVPYSDFPDLMRSTRLLCSVAVQEGGPLSFPEALASGCSTLSMMTGLPLGFASGCEGVWHMPMGATAEDWLVKIRWILSQLRPSSWPSSGVREQFLRKADYEHLGQMLSSICFD